MITRGQKKEAGMSQSARTWCDLHTFTLRSEEQTGESLELIAHADGGITVATALWQPNFCDATQASLTREQAIALSGWLAEALRQSNP
jgi:hypothetical protein